MKVKLNSVDPKDVIDYISKTEYAGLIVYDKTKKELVPIIEGIKVYFDPIHGVLEIAATFPKIRKEL